MTFSQFGTAPPHKSALRQDILSRLYNTAGSSNWKRSNLLDDTPARGLQSAHAAASHH